MGVSVSSTPIVSQSALPHLHLTSVCRHPEQAPPSSQTIATTFSPHSPRQIRKQNLLREHGRTPAAASWP